ncbi:unnamed protein product, partial [Rotaria socialis]
EKDDEQE